MKHAHDQGLAFDLRTMASALERRRVLKLLAGAAFLPLIGCTTGGADSACPDIPEETAGPYPGDGTNGANALTTSGIVRSDIRSSFGGLSGTAGGVPLTIELQLVNSANSCAALAGYAIYLWHCDRDGKYSLYTVANQNYLRGVLETDSSGAVKFTSIYPGCYSGRWPHIHFEIFKNLDSATNGSNKVHVSQLALPEDISADVYNNVAGYESSVANLARTSLDSDNVFGDGADEQLAAVTGDADGGYIATLRVGIDV